MSAVTVLTELADYVEVHTQGRHHQQAAVWNLTKARRFVQARTNGNIVTAAATTLTAHSLLRPTLTPTRTVQIKESNEVSKEIELDVDDIDLLDENDDAKKQAAIKRCEIPFFSILNGRSKDDQEVSNAKENTPENFDATVVASSASTGLRQRKGAAVAGASHDAWNVERTATAAQTKDPEVELLVSLFATMPPADLRKAQAEAVASLEAYCQAANIVAKLLATLPKANETD